MYKTISEIMNQFDFDRVLSVMRYLNWNWGMSVPTMDEIKEMAFKLLTEAYAKDSYSVSSGGFCATSFVNSDTGRIELSLEFILSSWTTS